MNNKEFLEQLKGGFELIAETSKMAYDAFRAQRFSELQAMKLTEAIVVAIVTNNK